MITILKHREKIDGKWVDSDFGDIDWSTINDIIVQGKHHFIREQWIPCSKGLPDHEALFCDDRGEMIIGYGFEDEDSDTGYGAEAEGVYLYNAVAWMELPEPYKGEER